MKNLYRAWLSKKLRNLREQKTLTVTEVANKLNKERPTYSAYEEGRAQPDLGTVEQICKLYGITPNDFFKDSPLSKC